MTLYDELVARGLIAQVTNEEEIKKMINEGKATFYIGFDCTADSLTAGGKEHYDGKYKADSRHKLASRGSVASFHYITS